jgi:hypothetical protein
VFRYANYRDQYFIVRRIEIMRELREIIEAVKDNVDVTEDELKRL